MVEYGLGRSLLLETVKGSSVTKYLRKVDFALSHLFRVVNLPPDLLESSHLFSEPLLLLRSLLFMPLLDSFTTQHCLLFLISLPCLSLMLVFLPLDDLKLPLLGPSPLYNLFDLILLLQSSLFILSISDLLSLRFLLGYDLLFPFLVLEAFHESTVSLLPSLIRCLFLKPIYLGHLKLLVPLLLFPILCLSLLPFLDFDKLLTQELVNLVLELCYFIWNKVTVVWRF